MAKKGSPDDLLNKHAGQDVQNKKQSYLSLGELLPFSSDDAFRTLIENINEVLFTLDIQGRFIYLSPAIEKITAIRSEEMIGETFDKFTHPDDLQILKSTLDHSLAGEDGLVEFRILDGQKEIHSVHLSSRTLKVDGKTVGLTGILTDITGRERSTSILNQTEEKYRSMIERIPVVVYTDAVDDLSSNIFMSPQIKQICGYSPEEWIADPHLWLKLVHPDDRSAVHEENERTNQTGDRFVMEYRLLARNGNVVWVRDEAILMRDTTGKPLCWQGVLLDITERKIAEQARQEIEDDLLASEERYRQMVELSPEAIAIHSDGKLVFANQAALRLIGAGNAGEVIGKAIIDFVHPDSRELAIMRIEEALSQQKALPAAPERFIKLDGTVIDVEVATMPFPFQGNAALQVLIRDVTERKHADALQEAVYQIAMATEATESLNDLFPQIHKIISSVMPAENFYITLYNEERNVLRFPYFKDALDEPYLGELQPGTGLTAYVLRTGKSLLCTQAVHDELERLGEIKLLGVPSAIWLGVPLIIEGKTIGAMVVQHYSDPAAYGEREQLMLEFVSSQVATAITRKQAEEALSNSEVSYRGLFNSVLEAITIQDGEGRFLDVNDGAVRMYGYPRGVLIGKTLAELSAPGKNDLDAVKKLSERVFLGEPQRFEFWGQRRDGKIFPEDVRVSKGEYYGQKVAIAVAQDITERKKVEEALQRQLKELTILEAIAVAGTEAVQIDDLLDRVTKIITSTFSLDSFGILLYEAQKKSLRTHPSYYGKTKENAQVYFPLGEGVTGYVAATGSPYRIDDVRKDKRYISITPGMLSEVCVPIKAGEDLLGVINVESQNPNNFSAADERLFMTIAGSLAIAIQKLRLFESEQHRRQEAETLREAVSIVASTLNAEQSIRLILEQLARMIPYDSASVQIKREDYLEIVGGKGWEKPEQILGMRFPIPGDNPNTVVVQTRQPYILANAPGKFATFQEESHQHIRSWMGIPLVAKNELIGLLVVDSIHENMFTDESARIATLFASQVAAALENTRLYEQALQAAERRAILHRASQEIARAAMNPEQIYEAVHRAAEQLMPAEAFVISLHDENRNEILGVYLFEKSGRWPASRTPAGVGLSGIVIASGKAVILQDLSKQPMPDWVHFGGEDDEVKSILAVPMRLGEKVIGMLSAQSYQPHVYTEEDQSLLEMLSAHAAVAIENARLYNETRQRLTELEMVNRVSTALRAAQTISEMLPTLLDETLGVLKSDSGAIWLFDPSRQVLREMVSRGWFSHMNESPIPPGEGIAGTVFQTARPYLTKEFSTDPVTRAASVHTIPAGWGGACVPIRTLQETIGVMFVAVQLPRQVLPEEVHFLTTLSEIAGNAIRRADLYHQTQRQVQRLASLRAIDMAINTILDLRVTLGILIDHILTQLKVDAVDVLLLNPRTQTLYHAASSGFHSDAPNLWQVHIGDDIAGKSVRTRTTTYIQNIRDNPQSKRFLALAGDQFISYYCVPLVAKGQVKGVMEIYHRSALEPDADWSNFLETLAGQAAIAIDNSVLFEELQRSNVDLALAYDATIEGWSKALDLRDRETEGHTQRVTELTLQLAQLMGVNDAEQVHIRRGALLHDIGKMGVPDNILNKAGPLTEQEWLVMRRHPIFAYEMLFPIAYLRPAVDIPYGHHERWNGKGYPRGLHGEQIPLAARLFAAVDVWDALTSDRPYRKAWTKKAAAKFIQGNSGILFDPTIAEIFLSMIKGEEE